MNTPINIENVILETERTILRPWKYSDLESLYEYASVDGVGQMAGWTPHKNIEESNEVLEMFIKEKKTFAVQLKMTGKAVGSIGIEELMADLGEPYSSMQGREIGYVLSKAYWGQGIMTEAVSKVIEYCFTHTLCEFLQCRHNIVNDRSRRVIEKSGFKYVSDHMKEKNGESICYKAYVLSKSDYFSTDTTTKRDL